MVRCLSTNLESSRMTQSFDLRFALRKEYTLNFSSFSHLIHINLSHSWLFPVSMHFVISSVFTILVEFVDSLVRNWGFFFHAVTIYLLLLLLAWGSWKKFYPVISQKLLWIKNALFVYNFSSSGKLPTTPTHGMIIITDALHDVHALLTRCLWFLDFLV